MIVTLNGKINRHIRNPSSATLLKFSFFNWENLIFKKEISQINTNYDRFHKGQKSVL